MKKLFEPIIIKNMMIPNRMVVSAMVTGFCQQDGMATESFIAYHEAKAKGGWGLIIPEDYVIAPGVGGSRDLPGLFNEEQIASHRQLTERVHQHGAKIACQIYHAGRRICRADSGVEPVGPSAIAFAGARWETPRALREDEIIQIVEQFAACALRAKQAGFDAVEIHGAHGYLLHSFVSPFSNKRTDAYGGCLEGRVKFSLDVVRRVRATVGEEYPIIYRMSVAEGVAGGVSLEEMKTFACMLEAAGVDLLHVSQGGDFNWMVSPSAVEEKAKYINHAAEIKQVISIPVIGVGRIPDPYLADQILQAGKADLVTMARASLADPALPNKAKAGRLQEINYCIGCLQGCTKGCTVNPWIGRESTHKIESCVAPKKVYIAGAGVAGCETAIIAAQRGHQVTLFETSETIGGQWLAAVMPPGKTDFTSFIRWQRQQLQELQVEIRYQCPLTKAIVEKEQPDTVVIATGGVANIPPIPGIDCKQVVLAQDVLLGKVPFGNTVAIIGGGSVGAETADYVAAQGAQQVTILEMTGQIAGDASARPRKFLLERLQEKGVQLCTNAQVTAIKEQELLYMQQGQQKICANLDTVILATGVHPNRPLEQELQDFAGQVFLVGDASSMKDGKQNILEGFETGFLI